MIQLDGSFKHSEAYTPSGKPDHPHPGGYAFIVREVFENPSRTNKAMLTVGLDIDEGEFKGFFAEHPKRFYQVTEGEYVTYFKGIVRSFLESNSKEKLAGLIDRSLNFHSEKLLGCRIGGCLREVEYVGGNGAVNIGVELEFLGPIHKISSFKPSPIKRLPPSRPDERRGRAEQFPF